MSEESSIVSEVEKINESDAVTYFKLEGFDESQNTQFINSSKNVVEDIKKISFRKSINILNTIPQKSKLHFISKEYTRRQGKDPRKHHPVKPLRGDVYFAEITENIGNELCGGHLVVVVSNPHTNIYGGKINVVPIEGDGSKVPHYLEKLTNDDMLTGKIDKDPSRIIIPEILTLDKSRLGIKVGSIKPEKMMSINTKLKKQLEL